MNSNTEPRFTDLYSLSTFYDTLLRQGTDVKFSFFLCQILLSKYKEQPDSTLIMSSVTVHEHILLWLVGI